MNDPRFEIYPHRSDGVDPETQEPARIPTGEWGWRFRAANGQITGIAGEGFTTEDHAERAIYDFIRGVTAAAYSAATGELPEIVELPDLSRRILRVED